MKHPYADIINHPHHRSKTHPQMTMHDRAAQFSPFAALTGYEDAIEETGRLTEERIELDEQERSQLDRRLSELASRLKEYPAVRIEYFVPDERKSGGAYITITGAVKKFLPSEGVLVMQDGTAIPFADIRSVDKQV